MLKLALGVVLSLGVLQHVGVQMDPWKIGLTPKPPTQGGQLTITGAPGAVIDLDWDPTGGSPTQVTIPDTGNITITVPSNATSLIASDHDGVAPDVTTTIYPSQG